MKLIAKPLTGMTVLAALASSVVLYADVPASRTVPTERPRSERRTDAGRLASNLRIKNVRLVAPSTSMAQPAAILKFEVANEGSQRLTDTLLEIVITERQHVASEALNPKIVAGPVTIHGKNILEAGYTLEYQMLLRNLSAECDCVASVIVLSARALVDSKP